MHGKGFETHRALMLRHTSRSSLKRMVRQWTTSNLSTKVETSTPKRLLDLDDKLGAE